MNADLIISAPPTFSPEFFNQVFSNCDISEKTRQDYLYRIDRFRRFVQADGGLNRNTLLEFKRSLNAAGNLSISTKNKHFTVAGVFLKQLFRLGILKVDISQGVKAFKVSAGFNVRNFTDDEVAQIIAGLNQSSDLRLKTIMSLQMFAGCRCVEITRLMVEDVSLMDGYIAIHGKGRDSKEQLPVIPQVIQVLRDYLKATKLKSGFLFTSASKRNRGGGLTTKSVWRIVRLFLDSLGIHRNPHQCRAFYVNELVKGPMGDNLFNVINFTRHRSIQTLQSYATMRDKVNTIPKFQKTFSEFVIS